jgi:hypothetical protein
MEQEAMEQASGLAGLSQPPLPALTEAHGHTPHHSLDFGRSSKNATILLIIHGRPQACQERVGRGGNGLFCILLAPMSWTSVPLVPCPPHQHAAAWHPGHMMNSGLPLGSPNLPSSPPWGPSDHGNHTAHAPNRCSRCPQPTPLPHLTFHSSCRPNPQPKLPSCPHPILCHSPPTKLMGSPTRGIGGGEEATAGVFPAVERMQHIKEYCPWTQWVAALRQVAYETVSCVPSGRANQAKAFKTATKAGSRAKVSAHQHTTSALPPTNTMEFFMRGAEG